MKAFLKSVQKVILFMQGISGVVLTFVILLTTTDVVLRIFGHPVPGAVEITAMCGGIIVGFMVPIHGEERQAVKRGTFGLKPL